LAAGCCAQVLSLNSGRERSNNGPGLVGVGTVADDLGGEHEGGDEEPVPGGPAGSREVGFQSLEEVEGSEGHRVGVQSGAVEGVCDKERKWWGRHWQP